MNRIVPEQRFRLPDDERPEDWCDVCKCELYDWESYYDYNGQILCDGCMRDKIPEIMSEYLVIGGRDDG